MEDRSWTRWVLAIMIGFPAIGYAYYYITKNGDNKKKITGRDLHGSKAKITPDQAEVPPPSLGPLDHALQLKENGNKFYKEGKYQEAVKCYSEAIDLCPSEEKENLSALYQNRAAAYELLGNVDEVIKNCTEAIKIKPTYLKALNRRYKAYEKVGQLRHSLEDITACCYLQRFTNENDISTADRLLKKIGNEEAERYMKVKPLVMPSKQFIQHYLSSLASDPLKDFAKETDETDLNEKGILAAKKALRESHYEGVFKGCDEEINLVKETSQVPSRKYYEALLLRGTMNVLINEPLKAKADLDNIIDATDADPDLVASALLKRACIYMSSENVEKAFEDFEHAEKVHPSCSDIYHQKAQMLLLTERIDEAVKEFEKAQKISPNFPLILIQKYFTEYKSAIEKQDAKKANIAKQGLKELVVKNPEVVEGYLLLAQIYNELQDYAASESLMTAAISSDASNSNIYVHRGLLYLQWKGDVESAVKDMQKAIECDPKCGFAYETFASVEVQRGNLINAISLFDKALPLTKSSKEAAHILSLKIAAQTQHSVTNRLGSFLIM